MSTNVEMRSIMGSSVSGILSAMRGVNLGIAGGMITIAVIQILSSSSAFKVMADALSIIYTMYVWIGDNTSISRMVAHVRIALCFQLLRAAPHWLRTPNAVAGCRPP
jgi:hypothetical protein